MKCESCGRSLDNGILVLPWENGNNPTAYVICSHCRHKNTVYGYGETMIEGDSNQLRGI